MDKKFMRREGDKIIEPIEIQPRWVAQAKDDYLAHRFGPEPSTDRESKEWKLWRQRRQNFVSAIDDFFARLLALEQKRTNSDRDSLPPGWEGWELPLDPASIKQLLKQYRGSPVTQKVSPDTRKGYASKVGQFLFWRAESIALSNARFGERLASLIDAKRLEGVPVCQKEIARQVGVSRSTICLWVNGQTTPSNLRRMHALEDFLCVEHGTLADLCPWLRPAKRDGAARSKFGEKQSSLMRMGTYGLPRENWAALLEHDCTKLVQSKMSAKKYPWTTNARGICASARRFEGQIEQIAGYCIAKVSDDPILSGLGMKPEELGLYVIAYLRVAIGFLEMVAYRSGYDPTVASPRHRKQIFCGTVSLIARSLMSLLKPDSGFVALHCLPPDPNLMPEGSPPLPRSVTHTLAQIVKTEKCLWLHDDTEGSATAALARMSGNLAMHAAVTDSAIRDSLAPLALCKCVEIQLGGLNPISDIVASALDAHPLTRTLDCSEPGNSKSWLAAYQRAHINEPLLLVLRGCVGHLRARHQLGAIAPDIEFLQSMRELAASASVRLVCTLDEDFADLPDIGVLLQRGVGYAEIYHKDPVMEHKRTCATTRQAIKDWLDGKEIVDSRDMTPGLRWVLDHKSPVKCMLGVAEMMRAHFETLFRAGVSKLACALAYRNFVIVRLLLEIPFREQQFLHLTWREDGTGDIYMRDGLLWVRQPKGKFKNHASSECRDWDAPLSTETSKLLLTYLREHRQHLACAESDFLILPDPHGAAPMNKLKTETLLAPFIVLGGFGPHAWRKIVVTDILHHNPNAEQEAARMINDSIEQVWLAYGKPRHAIQVAGFTARIDEMTRSRDRIAEFASVLRDAKIEMPADFLRALKKADGMALTLDEVLDAVGATLKSA